MNAAEVLQKPIMLLPMKDMICYVEGIFLFQSQQECSNNKVHP